MLLFAGNAEGRLTDVLVSANFNLRKEVGNLFKNLDPAGFSLFLKIISNKVLNYYPNDLLAFGTR